MKFTASIWRHEGEIEQVESDDAVEVRIAVDDQMVGTIMIVQTDYGPLVNFSVKSPAGDVISTAVWTIDGKECLLDFNPLHPVRG